MLHWLAFGRHGRFPCSVPLVLRARLHIFPKENQPYFRKRPVPALKRNARSACWLQTYTFPMKNQHFRWRNSTFSMAGLVLVLSWSWGGLVAPGAGQERSHAAWRSFVSKTMLPMQRGARSGPRGWRQLPARSAPMQRGVRFLQRRCFPCSVALVLGRGGGASGRPGATPKHQRVRW